MIKLKRTCSIDGCNKPVLARGWCNSHYKRWQAHGDPLEGRTFEGEPERFLNEVAATYTGNECLIWPFARSASGYGKIFLESKFKTVSRIVCERFNGPPPSENHQTAHSCGKGHTGCVSGNHLRWATPKENQADRYQHGTVLVGSQNAAAKLGKKEVSEIRSLIGRMSQRKIAEKFGVSQTLISQIKIGKAWRHADRC